MKFLVKYARRYAKTLGLRWKILLGYLVIAGLLLITGGWAIYNFISLNQAIKDIMISSYRSVLASQKMVEALEQQESTASLFILFGLNSDSTKRFLTNQQEFSKWYTIAEGNITFQGEAGSLKVIKKDYNVYLMEFQKLREMSLTDDLFAVKNFYLTKLLPQFRQVKKECYVLLNINQNHMVKADTRAKSNGPKSYFFDIACLNFSAAFGLNIRL